MRGRFAIVLAAFMLVASARAQDVEVQLEETGIASWSFLNPKAPVPIGTDQSIAFINGTGSRTFIVTIPFEFRAGEFETAYTVGERGWCEPAAKRFVVRAARAAQSSGLAPRCARQPRVPARPA